MKKKSCKQLELTQTEFPYVRIPRCLLRSLMCTLSAIQKFVDQAPAQGDEPIRYHKWTVPTLEAFLKDEKDVLTRTDLLRLKIMKNRNGFKRLGSKADAPKGHRLSSGYIYPKAEVIRWVIKCQDERKVA